MRVSALFAALIVVLSSLPSLSAASQVARAPAKPQLRLHRAALVQRQPRVGGPGVSLLADLTAQAAGPYAFIQFGGPITAGDRAALEQTGVALLEYVPDYAYLVRGSPAQLDAAALVPGVIAREPFTLADKLSPALLRALSRGENPVGDVQIVGWPSAGSKLQRDLGTLRLGPRAALNGGLLQQVAQLDSVRWIEPASRPRLLNDRARQIMRVPPVWEKRRLFGTGQIIAVTDSGLDTGVPATLSPDFAGRIVASHVLSPTGDLGDSNGHGTHVAGSVAGSGVQSGANPALRQYEGSFAGVAPEAGLVIQAFEADSNGQVYGLDADYYGLYAQSYADGARLHTNSWGDITGPITDTEAAYGGYPYGSQRTDQFMWEHPDMAIFFAAGNSGADGTPIGIGFCTGGDGVVDPDSLLAPATAKNVISVGASETNRSSGGYGSIPWLWVNFCFSTEPLTTDTLADDVNGMAAFSSRGPTDDGRAKPDLVAPGSNIVSNMTHYPDATGMLYETNAHYSYNLGTSMATPLAAGAGVLARQWLTQRGITNPSAAAVKAALLNTTHDMAPGQYGTGVFREIPASRPNSVAGWGRVDLGFVTARAPYTMWVDDHTSGLSTGQTVQYTHTTARQLEVLDSSQPLRVLIAWTDPPASLSAAKQLVNDLDLRLIGPDGTVYYGNTTPTGDRTNNVEGIVLNNPPLGRYTVEVRAHNVPIATQPYALSVGGPLRPAGQMTLTKTASPAATVAPGGQIEYTLSLSSGTQPIEGPIALTDTLPSTVSFVSASDGGAPLSAGSATIRWTIPGLAANTTITRRLVVRVSDQVVDGAQIVNADYRADNDADPIVTGSPVSVTVSTTITPTPTTAPTLTPTTAPTLTPTTAPTLTPTTAPTLTPTTAPMLTPTTAPTLTPTTAPTLTPTTAPTLTPTTAPTLTPTTAPTLTPTTAPTLTPTVPATATPTATRLPTITPSPTALVLNHVSHIPIAER